MPSVSTAPVTEICPSSARQNIDADASKASATPPLVSVIVVNYNGIDVLPKCLNALSQLTYPHCEIIVVDNGSKDGSFEFAEAFTSKFPQHVLKFPNNRGVAVARNAGVRIARGRFIAFIDNDGFAEPDWVTEALAAFAEAPRLGTIASLVLFDHRPDIINGMGGGISERGIGFDFLYQRPISAFSLPESINYPMGCGMVLRREVADVVFPIDEMLLNYYDDVEVGIRTWKAGYRVEPREKVKVRHFFNYTSSRTNPVFREILCHKNRLRTVLKYWPWSKIPGFILGEIHALHHFTKTNRGAFSSIFWWNLWNLSSVFSIRARFPQAAPTGPISSSNQLDLRAYPRNGDFSPDWEAAQAVVDMQAADHAAALDYGWYYLENVHNEPFRFTSDLASAFLRTRTTTNTFLFRFMPYTDEPFTVELVERTSRKIVHQWEFFEVGTNLFQIHALKRPVDLPAGDYQVLFRCHFTKRSACGRVLGVCVNFLGLWNVP